MVRQLLQIFFLSVAFSVFTMPYFKHVACYSDAFQYQLFFTLITVSCVPVYYLPIIMAASKSISPYHIYLLIVYVCFIHIQ